MATILSIALLGIALLTAAYVFPGDDLTFPAVVGSALIGAGAGLITSQIWTDRS